MPSSNPLQEKILEGHRKIVLASYPEFKDVPEIIPTLGQMVFECDAEFAQKAAIAAGQWENPVLRWDQLSPYTQSRWEALGAKVGHVLLEKCSEQINGLVKMAKVARIKPTTALIEDAIVVEETTSCPPKS